jgi:thioredoxin 1
MPFARPLAAALFLATAPLALVSSFASVASATEIQAFTPAAFEAAKASGAPLLVEVTAPWCPVCKVQRPILSELTAQPKFKDLKILNVDFDTQKDVLQTLGVRMQSTLISYKHGEEQMRSTGVRDKDAISTLLDKSL